MKVAGTDVVLRIESWHESGKKERDNKENSKDRRGHSTAQRGHQLHDGQVTNEI